jgi:hypothetical protein
MVDRGVRETPDWVKTRMKVARWRVSAQLFIFFSMTSACGFSLLQLSRGC